MQEVSCESIARDGGTIDLEDGARLLRARDMSRLVARRRCGHYISSLVEVGERTAVQLGEHDDTVNDHLKRT